jgi:hypothetical protein
MPRYKVTYIFDMPKHGFTESWWVDHSDTNLDAVRDTARFVAEKRALLMGDGCTMQACRIANADAAGRVGKTYSMIFTGDADNGSMPSNVAINCIFGTTDNQFQKIVQVRGGWDQWEGVGGNLIVNNDLLTRFGAWKAMLISKQFGFRSIVSRARFGVTGYTVTANGNVTVNVVHAEAPGTNLLTAVGPVGTIKTARFSKVNGKSRLNGTQVIVVTSPTTVELVKPLALTAYVSPGAMEVPSYTVRPVANGDIQRLGSRQAGAPLLASRGRAPARPRT